MSTRNKQKKHKNKNKKTLNKAALIIGIVSISLATIVNSCILLITMTSTFPIVLTLAINIFILLLATAGLIFGIINKVRKSKKLTGIVLNAIAIFLTTILTATVPILGSINYNPIAGNYSCKDFLSNSVSSEYTKILNLNRDGTFIYGDYNDFNNSNMSGTYSYYEKDEKDKTQEQYQSFMLNLTREKAVLKGKTSNERGDIEAGITLTSDESNNKIGLLIFANSYNMYICYGQ